MKRKLFLALVAIFVSMQAFSQFSWNVQAGANMNTMTKVEDAKMKFGYNFGVGMEYQFTDMWAFQTSLMYKTKGFKVSEDGEKLTVTPSYLQIPLLAAVKFELSENTKFVINAGPYLAYGLGGKAKNEFDGEEIKVNIFSSTTIDGDKYEAQANRFDFGLQLGAGFEFSQFLVGLNMEYGLAKVAKKDSMFEHLGKDGKKISPKNFGLGLSVGYKF